LIEAARERAEMLGGQHFVWSPRTPLLRAMIDGVEIALAAHFARLGLHARVLRETDLLISAQTAVIPDLAVFLGETYDLPDLIVEYRAESTDRLFFGPKRLAYGRARVPEVWFADPADGTVSALRLSERLDYPWPPATYRGDDPVGAARIAGLALPARAFFTRETTVHGHR